LYAYENWCVTLRKEYGLEVFENRILTDLYLGDGRPRPRWKNDIKLVLRDRRRGLEVDSLSPGQGLVLGSCEHGDKQGFHDNAENLSTSLRNIMFSRTLFHGIHR